MFLEYWGTPIENILSKTINMHPFCGNEEKKPTFHVDLIEFDHKTIPDFRFFSNISFIGPKMHLEYWGNQLKRFWAELPICVVFVETKKKKPIFHDYLIVFE